MTATDALKRQFHDVLLGAFKADGVHAFPDFIRVLKTKKIEHEPRSLRKYWEGTLPDNPDTRSHGIVETMLKALTPARAATVKVAWVDYVERVSSASSTQAVGEESVWYQVIPAQDGRDYTSIDRVTITEHGREFEGSIKRVHPDYDDKWSWTCRGINTAMGSKFLTFLPNPHQNNASTGTVNLTAWDRVSSIHSRPNRWPSYRGYYIRNVSDTNHELLSRSIEWYPRLPTNRFPVMALLDLDNTLKSGWCLFDWADGNTLNDLNGATDFTAELEKAQEAYSSLQLTHDELAEVTALAYARLVNANPPERIALAARRYVNERFRETLFEFTLELLSQLRKRYIAPVLVTGAPLELVREIVEKLDIEEFRALEVAGGEVMSNPGTAKDKARIVRELTTSSERSVVLGAGDSDSDLPILAEARQRLYATDLEAKVRPALKPQDLSFSSDTKAEEIAEWLSITMPDSYINWD